MNDDTPNQANSPEPTPAVEPTPTPPEQPSQPAPQAPKNRSGKAKRVLQIILIVVLIAIVGALTVFALKYAEPEPKPAEEKQASHHMTNMDHDHAKVIADGAKDLIAKNYSTDNPTLKLARADDDISPAYQTEGASFHVVGNIASTLTITIDTTDQTTAEELTTSIKEDLATYLEAQDLKLTNDDQSYFAEYQDDSVICTMPNDFIAPYVLSCANKSDYPELTTSMKPFADAMQLAVETVNDPADLTLISPATIKDSPVEGYQNATVSVSSYSSPVGSHASLLYKHDDGSWLQFRATQSILSCDEFNKSDDIRNAFAGEKCIDPTTDQESTVQPAPTTNTTVDATVQQQ